MKLEKYFREYEGLDFNAKVAKAKEAYQLYRAKLLANGFDDKGIEEVTWLFVRAAVGADAKASKEEHKLFQAIVDSEVSYAEFKDIAYVGSKQALADSLDNIVDSFDSDSKKAVLSFVAAFLSIDGKLGYDEEQLFKNFND